MRTIGLALLVGFLVTFIANVATTVYLHRALSHRALSIAAPVAHVFRFVTWMSTGIRPRQWVAVHRKHHAFTDEPGDPHSPAIHGWLQVQLRNYFMYRAEARNPATVERYAKDLAPDRLDRWVYDRAVVGLGLGVASLVALFGWQVGLLASFVHLNAYIGLSAAVNAIGHHFGRRRYANSATNNQWLAMLTAGEGLHNNHHAAPTSARLAHRWYEIDPGWYVIWALRTLRLARVRLNSLKIVDGAVNAATPARTNSL